MLASSPLMGTVAAACLVTQVVAALGLHRSWQGEPFPNLLHVTVDICGLQSSAIREENPCQYYIFGLASGYTECGFKYKDSPEPFMSCVGGCSSAAYTCTRACAQNVTGNSGLIPAPPQQMCLSKCYGLVDCIHEALHKATGQLSTASLSRACFKEPMPSGGAAPHASVMLQRNATGDGDESAFSKTHPECMCSTTGVIRGTDTGQPGCGEHGREEQAGADAYCFVEGSWPCGGVMPSSRFPGLFWRSCGRLNFTQFFPPTCELLARLAPMESNLSLTVSAQVPPDTAGDMADLFDATRRKRRNRRRRWREWRNRQKGQGSNATAGDDTDDESPLDGFPPWQSNVPNTPNGTLPQANWTLNVSVVRLAFNSLSSLMSAPAPSQRRLRS